MQENIPNIASEANNLKHIARNKCYEISYSKTKNRLYFNVLGFWKNKESVPDLLHDWEKALSLVSPGFTVLVDMRTMITHPQELNGLHEEFMQMAQDAHVSRVVNVMPDDKIASLQVGEIVLRSNMQIQTFDTFEAADKWLDQPSA
ncbi:hypothetical protein [uncultured Pontibacter sp.]|uniref:hypothetical protein n=1 Tax=uncultured Pontibacter sp. TaxID=453356 RepID=UPI00261C97AC|nr:hypothetical protein [uncultured Pontibacter sp.]